MASPLFSIGIIVFSYSLSANIVSYDKAIMALIVVAVIFGVGRYTDRILAAELDSIDKKGRKIVDDDERGRNWARRQLFVIYAVQAIVVLIAIFAARVIVVLGDR